jgi:hypothetical protein
LVTKKALEARAKEVRGAETREPHFVKAVESELESWRRFGAVKRVEAREAEKRGVVGSRFIYTHKDLGGGETKPKARLVAKGFQDPDKDTLTCAAPTAHKSSLRLALAICAMMGWSPNSIDIKTAFLQGEPIQREVYLRPPREAGEPPNILWRLLKSVYGLIDSPERWFAKVKSVLVGELGGKQCTLDPAVFVWYTKDGSLSGIISAHVDDFYWGGGDEFLAIVSGIGESVTVGSKESGNFMYSGMRVSQGERGGEDGTPKTKTICLDLNEYIKNLKSVEIPTREAQSPLTESELSRLRGIVGELLWVCTQCRPDIGFNVSVLASQVGSPSVASLLHANVVLARLKTLDFKVSFPKMDHTKVRLGVFADAAFGNLEGGGTQGGCFICLFEPGTKTISPVSWFSKKLRRVARSTLTGEVLGSLDGIDEGIVTQALWNEIFGLTREGGIKMEVFTDCKSLWDHLEKKGVGGTSEKRVRIDLASILEDIEKGIIHAFHWIMSEDQLADPLTKDMPASLLIQAISTNTVEIRRGLTRRAKITSSKVMKGRGGI